MEIEQTVEMEHTGRELRWLADAYEQAQRIRIETGERIRAVLQGRDETWSVGNKKPMDGKEVEQVLSGIKAGDTMGPVTILGRTYQRHWTEERELYQEMMGVLDAHPAWEWLDQVKGIGATLACKLLARLDVTKADTPSAFWAYCGLATVPANEYVCSTCSLRRSWPVGYNVKGEHKAAGTNRKCKGVLAQTHGPDDGVRCAQPKPARGQKASYDQYAKKICYLIGTSFLKSGGPYADRYRAARVRLETERVGWADGRCHLTALRKIEKLFLAHLWLVWREAVGLDVTEPYVKAELGHTGIVGPWDMIE